MSYNVQWDTGEGMARGISQAGSAIAGGLQQMTKSREEVDYLNSSWEFMKEQDPSLAQYDEKFTTGSLSAKRGLMSQAQTKMSTEMEQQEQAMKMQQQQQMFGMRTQQMQQEHAANMAEINARRAPAELNMINLPDGTQVAMLGSQVLNESKPGAFTGWQPNEQGTHQVFYKNGQPTQSVIPLPQEGDAGGFTAQVDPVTGAMAYQMGGKPVDPGNILIQQPGPYAPGQGLRPLIPGKEPSPGMPRAYQPGSMMMNPDGSWSQVPSAPTAPPAAAQPMGGAGAYFSPKK